MVGTPMAQGDRTEGCIYSRPWPSFDKIIDTYLTVSLDPDRM